MISCSNIQQFNLKRIAAMHNALSLTEPIPQEPINLYRRPFKGIAARGFNRYFPDGIQCFHKHTILRQSRL